MYCIFSFQIVISYTFINVFMWFIKKKKKLVQKNCYVFEASLVTEMDFVSSKQMRTEHHYRSNSVGK